MDYLGLAVIVLGCAVVGVTVLPFVPTTAGMVRIWDFPRPQILAAAVVALAGLAIVLSMHREPALIALAGLVAASAAYQLLRIARYTPVVAAELKAAGRSPDPAVCLSVLTANVLQTNRRAEALAQHIRTLEPDIVLLMETDDWWQEQIAPLAKGFRVQLTDARDNGYGMIFLSRLEARAELRYLVEPDIPSVRATIVLPSGDEVEFWGLHPPPPAIGQASLTRDGELLKVAQLVRDTQVPTFVAGDMNDVAWSHTSRLFQRISGFLDPRIGRGLFASFHADYALMRWPLDHLFVSRHFTLASFRILSHAGSDHFPVFARICLGPVDGSRHGRPSEADAGDRREAREKSRRADDAEGRGG